VEIFKRLDKALEKPPEQRYADVNQLAADLERFLRHEPLLARQHGPAYRTRKLLVRHRLRVAAAAIGLWLSASDLARAGCCSPRTLPNGD